MAKEILECSFCGRKKKDTKLLIAGIDAHICDSCIEQANGIVIEELKSNGKQGKKPLTNLSKWLQVGMQASQSSF